MEDLDLIDKLIVNRIQEEFPLSPRPFADLGLPHTISEDEVLARLARVKEQHIVRQISAILTPVRLVTRVVWWP